MDDIGLQVFKEHLKVLGEFPVLILTFADAGRWKMVQAVGTQTS